MHALPRATGPPEALILKKQTTAASTAKHQAAAVLHHSDQPQGRPSCASTYFFDFAHHFGKPGGGSTILSGPRSRDPNGLGAAHRLTARSSAPPSRSGPSRYDGGGVRYLRFAPAGSKAWRRTQGASARSITKKLEDISARIARATSMAVCSPRSRLGANRTRIPYQGVPVGTIKRFIAGKGNADKDAVIAAVQEPGLQPRRRQRS